MGKYSFSKKAVDDLSNIWNYTFDNWSERQADKYYQFLIEFCTNISDNPKMGKAYEEIAPGIMGYRANLHVIFYRVGKQNEIEIIRILHAQMDLKNRFFE